MRFFLLHSVLVFVVTFFCLPIFGCGSSQNTTTDEQKLSTEKTSLRNTNTVLPKPTANKKNTAIHHSPPSTGFAVQADTVDVQQGRKSVAVSIRQQAIKKNESKTTFGVQIGAFKSVANATSAELRLKNRFQEPTHSFFDEKLKMMRVFVGTFPTASLAEALLMRMKKEFPKEYSNCFVWELKK